MAYVKILSNPKEKDLNKKKKGFSSCTPNISSAPPNFS